MSLNWSEPMAVVVGGGSSPSKLNFGGLGLNLFPSNSSKSTWPKTQGNFSKICQIQWNLTEFGEISLDWPRSISLDPVTSHQIYVVFHRWSLPPLSVSIETYSTCGRTNSIWLVDILGRRRQWVLRFATPGIGSSSGGAKTYWSGFSYSLKQSPRWHC